MKLIEEYIKRHNIETTYAEYVRSGHVFHWCDEMEMWQVLKILWRQEPLWHPGHYKVRNFFFRHNGHQGHVLTSGFEIDVDWGDYEKFFREWAKGSKRITSNKSEATIAAWEASLFGWDGYLSRHATDESFFRTIDSDLDTDDRVEAIMYFIRSLRGCDFYDFWKREMTPMIKSHCDWIAKLEV